MSVPVVLASGIYTFLETPRFFYDAWISLVFSFAFGLLSIFLLLKYATKLNFFVFCMVFGVLCIVGGAINFIYQ
jgi:undecaprenyl pyrophosphate phosphatase UppP